METEVITHEDKELIIETELKISQICAELRRQIDIS